MTTDELIGFIAAFCAALSFGSYGVPMKGEAATRVDVDPLVFQSYKAFAVLLISSILIYCNNILADEVNNQIIDNANYYWTFHKWSFSDFTPWAFLSAILWVPGGTAGVYAVRRAGLAISVGIWSCVIVIISFIWGVLIFGEKQKSGALGAVKAVSVLCIGLCGIAYFSSSEPESEKKVDSRLKKVIDETTPLSSSGGDDTTSEGEDQVSLDLESFPHCGQPPHSHQTLHFHLPPLISKRTIHVPKYHLGLFFAFLNGLLAATIMIPLHYAPPHSTQGIGYSMSFGIAAMIVVLFAWLLRWMVCALQCRSVVKGYQSLPSFHFKDMLRPGMLAGLLYSIGNLSGIVSIQKLGNFMGYSLNQSSMIVSGLWGIFYYKEIPGFKNILGFISSSVIVFVGILLMGRDHQA
eukprot:scaffold7874_cov128-Skeletonema_marinoi.AAC.2